MYKDPTNFRKRVWAYKNGKMPYKNGRPIEDEEFESFRQTLPDNQKEPGDYRTRRYWELNDKPKTFGEAIGRGMYNLGDSGKYGQYGIEIPGWHANSVAYDKVTGNYEFMKPNSHPTRWMEDVYGYWGSDMQDFRENYKLQKGPVYDKYVPKKNVYKLPKFEGGKEPIDGGTPFGVVVTGRDRRPAWKRMYLNPRLGDTSLYYNGDAIRNITDWAPVVGDIGTAIDIKNAIQNNNYLEASALGAMMVLPDPIARGTKKLLRPISKKVKRLFQNVDFTSPLRVRVPEAENQTWAEITAEKYADKIATKNSIPVTKEEKEQFKRAWDIATRKRPKRSVQELTSGFTFANEKDKYRFVNLINRNPEYYEFLRREGISDPLNQESVSKFLDNQFTSVRGVVADTADDALPMLTDTQRGRVMSGGDRLDTYGGVYTSNSTTIADRFKNPQGTKIGNGYVAKVKYPYNISTDIPIEDLLEQYRKMILLSDRKNPLYGTKYYDKLRKDPNVVALESDYVGRASLGDKSVQERAYLPTGSVGEQKHTLDIVDLKEYKNQSDLHGRWLAEPETGSKAGLFIPRTLNDYSDFIRSARIVLSPQRNNELYRQTLRDAEDNFSKQGLRRSELLGKLYNTQRKLENIATAGAGLSPVGALFGYGVYKAKKENKFYDSPEFQQLLEDPNYEKYLNLDDGTFWKLSSLDKLERKYKTKYYQRIKGK